MNNYILFLENRLLKISKCLALTCNAEDKSLPPHLREEGLTHRHFLLSLLIKYCVVLFELQTCHE